MTILHAVPRKAIDRLLQYRGMPLMIGAELLNDSQTPTIVFNSGHLDSDTEFRAFVGENNYIGFDEGDYPELWREDRYTRPTRLQNGSSYFATFPDEYEANLLKITEGHNCFQLQDSSVGTYTLTKIVEAQIFPFSLVTLTEEGLKQIQRGSNYSSVQIAEMLENPSVDYLDQRIDSRFVYIRAHRGGSDEALIMDVTDLCLYAVKYDEMTVEDNLPDEIKEALKALKTSLTDEKLIEGMDDELVMPLTSVMTDLDNLRYDPKMLFTIRKENEGVLTIQGSKNTHNLSKKENSRVFRKLMDTIRRETLRNARNELVNAQQ